MIGESLFGQLPRVYGYGMLPSSLRLQQLLSSLEASASSPSLSRPDTAAGSDVQVVGTGVLSSSMSTSLTPARRSKKAKSGREAVWCCMVLRVWSGHICFLAPRRAVVIA